METFSALLALFAGNSPVTGELSAQRPVTRNFDVFFDLCPNKRLINTLKPRQNGRQFPDDIFKCIFLRENVYISIEISLKFVPNGPIDIIPVCVQIMAWRRPGDKPLSEPMVASVCDAYMRRSTSKS